MMLKSSTLSFTLSYLLCHTMKFVTATIQTDIDAAEPNAIIQLANQVYYEHGINYNGKAVSLIGPAIIDCQSTADSKAIIFENDETSTSTLKDITIRNCKDHGIIIQGTKTQPTIENVSIYNCEGKVGSAIYIESSNPTITNITLEDNTGVSGGALAMVEGKVTINGCKMKNNTAQNGGAIYAIASELKLKDCSGSMNAAIHDGGFLKAESSLIVINDSNIQENKALNGGAISTTSSIVNIGGSTFSLNEGSDQGGGFFLTFAAIDGLTQDDGSAYNLITGNTFTFGKGNKGGIFYVKDGADSVFKGNLFESNEANQEGSAIYCKGVYCKVESSIFRLNTAGEGGTVTAKEGTLEGFNNIFENNEGIEWGGGYYCEELKFASDNDTFVNNKAAEGNGGALFLNAECEASVIRSTFENNEAVNGGALFLAPESSISMVQPLFLGNRAEFGGAIYSDEGSGSLATAIFRSNAAFKVGGAFYLKDNGNEFELLVPIDEMTFNSNTANDYGNDYSANKLFVKVKQVETFSTEKINILDDQATINLPFNNFEKIIFHMEIVDEYDQLAVASEQYAIEFDIVPSTATLNYNSAIFVNGEAKVELEVIGEQKVEHEIAYKINLDGIDIKGGKQKGLIRGCTNSEVEIRQGIYTVCSNPAIKYISDALFYCFVAISILLFIGIAAVACMTFLFRIHVAFKSASINILMIMLLGSAIACFSVVLLGFNGSFFSSIVALDRICISYPFVFTLAFYLLYGGLIMKTYRLHRIFHDNTSVQISDISLGLRVAPLVFLDFIVAIVWAIVNPLEIRYLINGTEAAEVCRSDNFEVYLALSLVIKALPIVLGIFVSFKMRKAHKRFNESRPIAMSLYQLIVGALVGISLGLTLFDPNPRFAVQAVFIILGAIVPVIVIWTPKFIDQRKNPDETVSSSNKTRSRNSKRVSNTNNGTHKSHAKNSSEVLDNCMSQLGTVIVEEVMLDGGVYDG